uniref:Uncharacterized protein n=1 Tax=Anguilla anguilla TaxID=7936 RepID=A0A0E9SM35_ANGAN
MHQSQREKNAAWLPMDVLWRGRGGGRWRQEKN